MVTLAECLNVHFAGGGGGSEQEHTDAQLDDDDGEADRVDDAFVSFAISVAEDEKTADQFTKLVGGKIPANKRGEFWRALLQSVRAHLRLPVELRHMDPVLSLAMLAISTWMDAFPCPASADADTTPPPPPQALLDLLGELHDSLFELHDELPLQDEVAKLCERWYLEQRPSRERVVPQLVPTLIMNSFDANNCNRVFALRDTLPLFDFSSCGSGGADEEVDASTAMLKRLVLKCFVSPVYLKSPKGKRVLSHIMTLSEDMMMACHNEMMAFPTKSLEPFAQVYFDTWLLLVKRLDQAAASAADSENDAVLSEDSLYATTTRLLSKFEDDLVLNDLVQGALFHRDAGKRKLRVKMLDLVFHDNKREKRVDELLCRLYSPVLFPALNATNSEVRRNASTVLFNAFPLHDPYSGVQEIASVLDAQFLAVESLLQDRSPDCRAHAASGTCRLLALFWETIPKSRCSRFMHLLVNDLAFDKTSPLVRQHVLTGLAFMLDFPLCHGVLRTSLRFLRNHFHDRALTVRAEFCKLLGKLDSTVGFAFTDFVTLEDVLHRLHADAARKSLRVQLCTLLCPVFFPKDAADNVEQLKRARVLASSNLPAAKVFFSSLSLVCGQGEWNRIVKLMLLFGSFVNARRREIEAALQEQEEEGGEEEEQEVVDVEDVEQALACIEALWEPMAAQLAQNPLFASSREKLAEMFDAEAFLLPLWTLRRFKLLGLCKLIGPGSAALEKKILKRLYVGGGGGSGGGVDMEVDLICSWNGECVQRVMRECVRSLTMFLEEEDEKEEQASSKTKKKKKRLDETRAVKILGRIMLHQPTAVAHMVKKKKPATRDGSGGGEQADGDDEAGEADEQADEDDDDAKPGVWRLFELAHANAGGGGKGKVVDALLLLELKLAMRREDCAEEITRLLARVYDTVTGIGGEGALSLELVQGIFLLAADCVALGLSVPSTVALPLLRELDTDLFRVWHVDRFVFRLLQAHQPCNNVAAASGDPGALADAEELFDVVCSLFRPRREEEEEEEGDGGGEGPLGSLLVQWFQLDPKQVFRRVVLPHSRRASASSSSSSSGGVVAHLERAKTTQVFAQVLGELERDGGEDAADLLAYCQRFALREEWDEKTKLILVRDLVHFSHKFGEGLLGDQIHNLASELSLGSAAAAASEHQD